MHPNVGYRQQLFLPHSAPYLFFRSRKQLLELLYLPFNPSVFIISPPLFGFKLIPRPARPPAKSYIDLSASAQSLQSIEELPVIAAEPQVQIAQVPTLGQVAHGFLHEQSVTRRPHESQFDRGEFRTQPWPDIP